MNNFFKGISEIIRFCLFISGLGGFIVGIIIFCIIVSDPSIKGNEDMVFYQTNILFLIASILLMGFFKDDM